MSDGERSPARKTRDVVVEQLALIEMPFEWREHWWGMPSFEMKDARPLQRITVNFYAWDDVVEFGRRLGLPVTRNTDSLWFPPESVSRPNEWGYDDES